MAEKPPAFVVVDKRKFTSEGDIREGFIAPEAEPPAHAAEPVPAAARQEPVGTKVVTMPARAAAADDLGDEEMAGSLAPLGAGGMDLAGGNAYSCGPEADFASEDAFAPGTDYDAGEDALDLGPDGAPLGEPRSAAETEAQDRAYRQSSRELDALLRQANPGMQVPGVVAFEHIVQSFYLSAIMAMGAGTEPGQKPRIDIVGARQSIDMLTVLEEKTRGNLSAQEAQLLQGIAFELRMMFLELTNAISKQAHQPVPGQPGGGLR